MNLSRWLGLQRGRTQELSLALGVSASLVLHWSAGRKGVSAERCVPIEEFTDRAVRRWDLRPDDWHRIWPELIGTDGAPPVPEPIARAA